MNIQIRQTDSEFLINLPYSERDRAKRISMHRWDPAAKCWRYPRTRLIHAELLQEFGPEETVDTSWMMPIQNETPSEVNSLKEQLFIATGEALNARRELVDALERSIERGEKVIEVNQELIEVFDLAEHYGFAKEGDTEQLKVFLRNALSAAEGAAVTSADGVTAAAQLATLREENTRLHAECSRLGSGEGRTWQRALLEVAQVCSGPLNSPALDRGGRIDQFFTLELQKSLQAALLALLGRPGERGSSLAALISEARDAGVLSADGSHLAHSVRVQRNRFAHEDVPDDEATPRAVLALMAYVLVLKELRGGRG